MHSSVFLFVTVAHVLYGTASDAWEGSVERQ